jgi:hypothetical protein
MGKSEQTTPFVVTAYSVVPDKEQEIPAYYTVADGTVVELDTPAAHSVAQEQYAHIPETKGLSWRDDFFEDENFNDVVAVFDYDYEGMEGHYMCASWGCLGLHVCQLGVLGPLVYLFCCPSIIPWMLVGLVPCHLNKNVRWNVRAQHIALTQSGIIFVHDRRPACWGEECCSVSKHTKFIPYDQITECVVTDSGNSQLSKVTIDTTARSNTSNKHHCCRHDLEIVGLENPHAFQKLVIALMMKRGQNPQAAAAPDMVMEDRGAAHVRNDTDDAKTVAGLLREIRDELRKGSGEESRPDSMVEPSAPPAEDE